MNVLRCSIFLALIFVGSTFARPSTDIPSTITSDENEEFELKWPQWIPEWETVLKYWAIGLKRAVSGQIENSVVIERLNVDRDHLLQQSDNTTLRTNENETDRDEWVMINAPLFVWILFTAIISSCCLLLCRCLCC
ncbi:hypothetical protein M3Y94_00612100 [Aphelenchoides besseyi]|nr:hypothetical protein M3Y94_00612100 [Aphelenchoides besseyi]